MKTHTIQWKSRANGRSGASSRLLKQEEAERLAAELNREYPHMRHEAIFALPNPIDTPEHKEIAG